MMWSSWRGRGCRCVVIAIAVLFLYSSPASPQRISVVREISGPGTCYLDTGNPGTNYIVAELGSLPAIAGAEFSVSGLPPGASAAATPNPAAIASGDPFGGGCAITFSECQAGSYGVVLLYTVTILAPPGTPFYTLQVTKCHTPSNPGIDAPVVYLCNSPQFTPVSVQGVSTSPGPLLPVPSDPIPQDATVNVSLEPQLTWGLTGPFHCCGIGTPYALVYFGSNPDPPLVCRALEDCQPYTPGRLEPETTYYWRVVATPDHDCGDVSGPVWRFTTGRTIAVHTTNWDVVKQLYRD